MLADPHFPALLDADQVATLQSATGLDEDALAFALLPLAAACARADLSHFNVGAIARGVSGTWYFGGNMEFLGATMQQTVHAEQSAISHAWLRGEKSLSAITVNYTPCGHCRQFMNELNSGLRCAFICRVAKRIRWSTICRTPLARKTWRSKPC
jgi:cytidine deaminase